MDKMKALSSVHFEMKLLNAKNIQLTDSTGFLFVRCYLPAGKNKRVRFQSQEIYPNVEVSWNESFAFDCLRTKQSIDMINRGTIVFELRWRSGRTPLLQKLIGAESNICGSQVLGRAEVPWRDIFESPNMESERWVVMKPKKHVMKAASIHITMKIRVIPPVVATIDEKTKNVAKLRKKRDESCGCSHGHCCDISGDQDSEMAFIVFALDDI